MKTLTEAQTKAWRISFALLTPILLVVGVALLREGLAQEESRAFPEYSGEVISSDFALQFGVMRRPELKIRVDGQSVDVRAVLMTNSAAKIPKRVSFHWSGEPGDEVWLKEESSPWPFAWVALLGGPVGFVLIHLLRAGGPFDGAPTREKET